MPAATKSPSLDRLFRALADRTRLQIVYLLLEGELCVCDLVGALEVPQPTASRHLAYLRRAGLVVARKEGAWAYYRLAEPAGPIHAQLLGCLKSCFAQSPPVSRSGRRVCRRVCHPGECCD
jgi:ArsR family transcriptional regulator